MPKIEVGKSGGGKKTIITSSEVVHIDKDPKNKAEIIITFSPGTLHAIREVVPVEGGFIDLSIESLDGDPPGSGVSFGDNYWEESDGNSPIDPADLKGAFVAMGDSIRFQTSEPQGFIRSGYIDGIQPLILP